MNDEWNYRNTIESMKTRYNFAVPAILGAAECASTFPAAAANEKLITGVNNDVTYSNSSSLRDLPMSEILKLADDRARFSGVIGHSTNNPWHKRMAVSDNITRSRTSSSTPSNRQRMLLTGGRYESDNNEEFFENLMTKMTNEQFMPNGKASRLRKRTCLWNKENSSDTIRRYKERRIDTKLIAPTMEVFAKRLLPPQNNNNSSAEEKSRSRCEAVEERRQNQAVCRGYTATLDLIQEEKNMKELPSCFMDNNNSSLATRLSIDQSFHQNQASHDRISTCTQETLKLKHKRLVDRIEQDTIHEASPRHYYAKRHAKNFWDSPCLSTIEEYRKLSMIVESPDCGPIDTEFDMSIQLTPPLSTESIYCEACNFDEEEHDDNVNNNSSQISSLMRLGDRDREISGILYKSPFA